MRCLVPRVRNLDRLFPCPIEKEKRFYLDRHKDKSVYHGPKEDVIVTVFHGPTEDVKRFILSLLKRVAKRGRRLVIAAPL